MRPLFQPRARPFSFLPSNAPAPARNSLALTRAEGPRAQEVLDVVKFVCRDVWMELHQKQVDKLQTNNKGVFVLQDLSYRWTRYLSPPSGSASTGPELALKYVIFPCGLVRGALAAFDVHASVNADVSASPRVLFHIDATAPPAVVVVAAVPPPAPAAAAPVVAPPAPPA